jgi:hypothetical protein
MKSLFEDYLELAFSPSDKPAKIIYWCYKCARTFVCPPELMCEHKQEQIDDFITKIDLVRKVSKNG